MQCWLCSWARPVLEALGGHRWVGRRVPVLRTWIVVGMLLPGIPERARGGCGWAGTPWAPLLVRLHRWHHICFCVMGLLCCASIWSLLAFSHHPEKFLEPGLGLICVWNKATLIIYIMLCFFLKIIPSTESTKPSCLCSQVFGSVRRSLVYFAYICGKPQKKCHSLQTRLLCTAQK